MIGSQDIMVGLVIALFFFGAKKLPELAGSLGKSMKEFKKAVSGEEAEKEPEKGAVATAVAEPAKCAGCQTVLQPEWAHCPKCGAAASPSSTSPSP